MPLGPQCGSDRVADFTVSCRDCRFAYGFGSQQD
jgi:hypothetical protein